MQSTTTTTTNLTRYGQEIIPAQSIVVVTTANGGRVGGIVLRPTHAYTRTLGEYGASIPGPMLLDTGASVIEVGRQGYGWPTVVSVERVG